MSSRLYVICFNIYIVLTTMTISYADSPIFVDQSDASGLNFYYFNGMSGEFYLIENLGGGAALFDYDNDGDLDIYLVQGKMLGNKPINNALFPAKTLPLQDKLFRNDSNNRQLKFTDVTDTANIQALAYGMGVAVADINNDGWLDIYVNNFGGNQLWQNQGNGKFVNITALSKTAGDSMDTSVSASFIDIDKDGWLDLYVGNYVDFSIANNKTCYAPSSARDYCSPVLYNPRADQLWHNQQDLSFKDIAKTANIAQNPGNTLGVITADFNHDNWIDIYVASDGLENQLWLNQHNQRFEDNALLAGVAVNADGMPEASMGVDAGDIDNDGDEDLFMTHFLGETNTLYINDGQGWFEDQTIQSGLATPSKPYTAFGTAYFDYDNDGLLDVFIANGGVNIIPILQKQGDPYPLHQPNQLFHNLGQGKFVEVTEKAGEVFKLSEVSRGAAFGDIDNDGDTDILVVNNNGKARLLINQIGQNQHWLGLNLISQYNRVDSHAKVKLETANKTYYRRVRADGSYASANDTRILIGLGQATKIKQLTVYWSSGQQQQWHGLKINQYHTLYEKSSK